jgi:predicted TIM-barrel enzyme
MTDAPSVAQARESALKALFGRSNTVLIGVVHLLPLPGSPDYSGGGVEPIYARALGEARAYADAGFDGIIVENHGDIPFSKPEDIGPETAAHMAIATDRVRSATGLPVGINVLANAALHALAIASAAGARFVRVNQWANAYVANEGLIEGAAAKATRYRSLLQARDVKVFADAHVKHGAHAIVQDRPIADLDYLRKIRAAGSLPTLVGSGVDSDNVGDILAIVDGVIVASALKVDGRWWNPVDRERAKLFVERARKAS